MRKIFLDCGSYDGCSVRKFTDLYDSQKEFEYFSFEGNPHLFKYHPVHDRCTFVPNIVSDSEEEKTFYVHGTTGGSTTSEVKNKRYRQKYHHVRFGDAHKVTYNPIVLWRFIKENFSKDDHIVLKLDVEGEEYCILESLIENNCLNYINNIYIEWHGKGRTDYSDPKSFEASFKKTCDQNGIAIDSSWDALHPPYMKERNNTEADKYKPIKF